MLAASTAFRPCATGVITWGGCRLLCGACAEQGQERGGSVCFHVSNDVLCGDGAPARHHDRVSRRRGSWSLRCGLLEHAALALRSRRTSSRAPRHSANRGRRRRELKICDSVGVVDEDCPIEERSCLEAEDGLLQTLLADIGASGVRYHLSHE
jgi:hypothetical protein